MKKATSTKTNIKFGDWLASRGSVAMTVYHQSKRPKNMLTLNEVIVKYANRLGEGTIRLYAATGQFVHPTAMMYGKSSLSWLYDADAVEQYMSTRKPFDKQKYDEMVEKARALQAKGARLRYKADKMKDQFQVTIKESK